MVLVWTAEIDPSFGVSNRNSKRPDYRHLAVILHFQKSRRLAETRFHLIWRSFVPTLKASPILKCSADALINWRSTLWAFFHLWARFPCTLGHARCRSASKQLRFVCCVLSAFAEREPQHSHGQNHFTTVTVLLCHYLPETNTCILNLPNFFWHFGLRHLLQIVLFSAKPVPFLTIYLNHEHMRFSWISVRDGSQEQESKLSGWQKGRAWLCVCTLTVVWHGSFVFRFGWF